MHSKCRGYAIILLMVAAMLCVLASCGSGGLPPEGKNALDECIARLAGTKVNYRIISAQKAPGTTEEQRTAPQLPSSSGVSGCPPDSGDRETWCIVIGQEIADKTGQRYSHFLLRRLGSSWYVEELTDAQANRFEYVGCTNWNIRR
ncbi:MAG: hypothetical protein H5T68_04355 [Chloroflexi bacterium]|nr:hypothetical protein [Chloroflexota bacterium]